MKESLALTLSGFQGLGSDDSRERPVDRLAAMGAIQITAVTHAARSSHLNSLGVDLIAFKFGNRAASKEAAENKLTDILAWGSWNLNPEAVDFRKVAQQAIREWIVDICPACSGAGQIPHEADHEGVQPMQPCPTCHSTGKRRYTDAERREAFGADYSKAMSIAHGVIGQAEDGCVWGGKGMLERW